jgi:hypothetical protein
VARATAGTAGAPPGHRIPRPGTLGGRALATLEGQLCRDADLDGRTDARLSASTGTRSSIIVPLVHDGAGIALIAAVSSRADAFDEDDLELLGMLAEVASSRLATAYADADRRVRAVRWRAAQELTGLAWWELDLVTGAHHWSDEMFRPGRPRALRHAARRRRLPRRRAPGRPRAGRRAPHGRLQHRAVRGLPRGAPRRSAYGTCRPGPTCSSTSTVRWPRSPARRST